MFFGYENFEEFYDFINPVYRGKRYSNTFHEGLAEKAIESILSRRDGRLGKLHDLKTQVAEIEKTEPPEKRVSGWWYQQPQMIDYHFRLLQELGARGFFDTAQKEYEAHKAEIEKLEHIIDANPRSCFKTFLYKKDIERRKNQDDVNNE